MGHKDIIEKIKPEFEKVITFLEREVAKIRTGRASPTLVEDIIVDYLGTKIPIKQLGTISCPTSKEIVIQPWDKSSLELIEKAISQTNIGVSPVVDKEIIRVNLPLPSEEFRQELLHLLSEKQEEARKTIRYWREEAWKEIQAGFRESKIREDDKFRAKDELQELVDEYNEKIETIGERKKKEVLES